MSTENSNALAHLTKDQLINLLTVTRAEVEQLELQLDKAEEKLEILKDSSELLYLAKQIVDFANWHNPGYGSTSSLENAKSKFVHILEQSNELCRRFDCAQSQTFAFVPEGNIFQ